MGPSDVAAGQISFSAAAAGQMRRVLRLATGDEVLAFDGSGLEYTVRLDRLRDDRADGTISSSRALVSEPALRLTLIQALLPREKLALVLQKSTEVGVSRFLLIGTERSLVPARTTGPTRLERWERIVREAAEQSGRAVVPAVELAGGLEACLTLIGPTPLVMCWEGERRRSLNRVLRVLEASASQHGLSLLIGPEGGFSEAEARRVEASGGLTASLGPRILRAETAGPIAAALALAQFGELEPIE